MVTDLIWEGVGGLVISTSRRAHHLCGQLDAAGGAVYVAGLVGWRSTFLVGGGD